MSDHVYGQPPAQPGPDPARGAVQPFGAPLHPVPPLGYGPGQTLFPQPFKDTTAAWLLWFFLGHWGAHDFYLRRTGAAVAKIVLTGIGIATAWFFVGLLPLFAVFVWWIVDAATMSGRLQQVNTQVYAHNRAIGAVR